MRWRKLGLLFRPDGLEGWMASHAAVPFAVPLGGSLARVYFATRDRANRSSVAWVVLDLDRPGVVLDRSTTPALGPGRLGTFDDSGAMPSWIVADGDREWLYYIGWNLGVTVPFRNAVGLAVREGSGEFRRVFEGPIIDRSPTEPHFATNPCVLRDGPTWTIWYLSCVGWDLVEGRPRHRYHIKVATSADGIAWDRRGQVAIDFRDESEYAISRPCVVRDPDRYRIWYAHRGVSYRIGYAESADGIAWDRRDEDVGIDVSDSGWDSEMIAYPHVFDCRGARYMLYNGNDFGRTGFGLAVLERP